MRNTKKKILTAILAFGFLIPIQIFAQNFSFTSIEEFSELESEDQYLEFLRETILEQPEFSYATAILNEAEMNLRFNRRQRLPELSLRVINDEVLDRKIKSEDALRKIRDDSFDGVVEIRQAIYSGGKINAGVRKAKELSAKTIGLLGNVTLAPTAIGIATPML